MNIPRDANHLSNSACVVSARGSTTVVVDGDLGLLGRNGVGNSGESVHCNGEDEVLKAIKD